MRAFRSIYSSVKSVLVMLLVMTFEAILVIRSMASSSDCAGTLMVMFMRAL